MKSLVKMLATLGLYTLPVVIENLQILQSTIRNIEIFENNGFLSKYYYLVPERKLSFSPISASDKNYNPRNI